MIKQKGYRVEYTKAHNYLNSGFSGEILNTLEGRIIYKNFLVKKFINSNTKSYMRLIKYNMLNLCDYSVDIDYDKT